MAVVSSLSGVSLAPLPQPGPTPRPAAPTSQPDTPPLGEDRIMRPAAEPSPGHPNRTPSGPYDALPVLAAAALVAGGAVVALPTLEAAAVGIAAGAERFGSAFARGNGFAKTTARALATEYRAAAGSVASARFTDPQELGKALGAQCWTATEELGRSIVVGAGLAGGAWAARKITAVAEDAIAQTHARATSP